MPGMTIYGSPIIIEQLAPQKSAHICGLPSVSRPTVCFVDLLVSHHGVLKGSLMNDCGQIPTDQYC